MNEKTDEQSPGEQIAQATDATTGRVKTGVAYPQFADREAECIWLQSQLMRLQGLLDFQSNRLRLRADLWEAVCELDLAHAAESKRLAERVTELEALLAQVLAEQETGKRVPVVVNAARMALSPTEHNMFPQGRWSRQGAHD